ncbi:hypothetical protein RclHR1_16130003 [Rhizophagus clarus]|uniref:Basic-leucine zipper transcription factor n=1 Tax=Rhizophagus clarus TaxID=94130 RepID=A0A2Z6QGZ5_9GLOM|nr:hypothetical protein RclHR1_16130003 [Rhizophagus clarus]GES72497.1 basic-leucine zipper transcription factor [Rhizophagus clarus]
MAMSRNFSSNDPNSYGSDDAFDTYIDMDFLRNNAMEEDVDYRNMSSSDLFRYYLEDELIKDTEVLEQPPPPTTYSAPIQTVANDFSLVTSSVPVTEDLKLTSVPVIEETNETTQQAIATTAVGPSLAILNAQLAELLAKLPTIKQEAISDKIASPTSPKTQTLKSSNSLNNNNAQKSDDSQIDMKKLSSKERRQIRNKISARNFRVRRKEYIQNLETTKEQQQEEINLLRQALLHLQEENTKLQQEVEELRKQKQQNTKTIVTSPPSPPHISSPATTRALPSVPPHQPSSPASRYLVIPNVNKDASPSSSPTNQKTWQDSRVRVQTTFIPEFNLDKHLFKEKSTLSYLDFNNSPYRCPSMIDLIEFSQSVDGQRFWLAYMLISTAMQQMTNLFIEAVCATPKNQMISALFPNVKTPALEHASETHFQSLNEEERESEKKLESSLEVEQINSEAKVQEASLLDNNTMVESVKEASVLDWLYDAMVKHVVEQSQMEAKMTELSDWVGEEWDDNVLPFLF